MNGLIVNKFMLLILTAFFCLSLIVIYLPILVMIVFSFNSGKYQTLPFREPTERIARYGQGFSKILSHMRPNDLLAGGTGSPGRNGLGGSHHQSVDDSNALYPGSRYTQNPGLMTHSEHDS